MHIKDMIMVLVNIAIKIIKKAKFIAFSIYGELAQLARAFDWQSKGRRFDSCILHNTW